MIARVKMALKLQEVRLLFESSKSILLTVHRGTSIFVEYGDSVFAAI